MNTTGMKDTFLKLGLDNKEADVYFTALKLGTCASSGISNMTGIPKSSVRYSLEALVKKGMIIKTQKGNTALFTSEHPNIIKNLLIIEKNKIEDKQHSLDSIMGDLISIYNPYTKIPKVTFYEGIDGVKKVLEDSLSTTENIDGFVNVDDVIDNLGDINEEYTKKRIDKGVNKRSIYSSTDKTKEYLKNIYDKKSLNTIKYLDSSEYKLYVSFMIYDGKISYITFKNNSFIGVIIENSDIYNFHKNIFKFMWKHL